MDIKWKLSLPLPQSSSAPTSPYPSPSPSPSPSPLSTPADSGLPLEKVPSTHVSQRPENPRSSTEPTPSSLQSFFVSSTSSSRPFTAHRRNKSPYSRSHLRSRSSGSVLAAPVMARAHSMPTVITMRSSSDATQVPSPSPMRLPTRLRSPVKPLSDDGNTSKPPPRSPSWFDGPSKIVSIQEDSELELTPRPATLSQPAPFRAPSLQRLRPASPLHNSHSASLPTSFPTNLLDQNSTAAVSGASSGASSPALGPQRYNESYPGLHHYASTSSFSSMPSTPTSTRSRSPSISSLDTIEDEPDLESEAVEDERVERLQVIAERAERLERGESEDDPRRRRSLDAPRQQGFGFGRGGSLTRERKRWSICGGERRADLDLETIWED